MIRLYPQPGDSPWVEAVLTDDVAYALAAKATTAAVDALGITPNAATRERMTERIASALGTGIDLGTLDDARQLADDINDAADQAENGETR